MKNMGCESCKHYYHQCYPYPNLCEAPKNIIEKIDWETGPYIGHKKVPSDLNYDCTCLMYITKEKTKSLWDRIRRVK